MQSAKTGFAVAQAARFTQERLDVLSSSDHQRLQGLVCVVEGFYKCTRKPIVCFPTTQNELDIRLFGADHRQLELFAEAPDSLEQNGSRDTIKDGSAVSQTEAIHLFD